MQFSRHRALAASVLLAATVAHAGTVRVDENAEYRPTGKGWGELADSPGVKGHAKGAAKPGGGNGIFYNGGPVLLGTTTVYYIWYGDWGTNTAPSILEDFARFVGGSPYYNINTTYYDRSNRSVSNSVAYGGSATVTGTPYGTSLSDANIQSIVSSAISSKAVPSDTNAVYFVLTSKEVTASSGFCTQYCGWHTHASIGGADIKYSFVGNPERCPASCSMQATPNDNLGADGMASIIAHELEEAVTDPDLNAWYDRRGYENADKCAWTFGSQYTSANGSTANMRLGTRDFLIQQNWVNASGGYCAKSYP